MRRPRARRHAHARTVFSIMLKASATSSYESINVTQLSMLHAGEKARKSAFYTIGSCRAILPCMAIQQIRAIRSGQLGRVDALSAAGRGSTREDASKRLEELRAEREAASRARLSASGERSLEAARVIAQLRSRDSQVRGHEAAHVAVGGSYVRGGASFSYEKGPDGHQYAVGGEVGIDTSPVPGKPSETIAKMQTVRAAALAPSDPSGADNAVAAAAAQMEAEAIAELSARRTEQSAPRAEPAAQGGGTPAQGAARAYGAEKRKGDEAGASPGSLIDLAA
jgi:hypothetical protein